MFSHVSVILLGRGVGMPGPRYLLGWAGMPDPLSLLEGGYVGGGMYGVGYTIGEGVQRMSGSRYTRVSGYHADTPITIKAEAKP